MKNKSQLCVHKTEKVPENSKSHVIFLGFKQYDMWHITKMDWVQTLFETGS